MKKYTILIITMLLVFALALPTWAGDEEDEFSGSFLVGYRGVDVDGVETKYKEDYNLDQGARLFRLNFHYKPAGKMKKYFDSLSISLNNFGGDPFESLSFSVVKHGTYKFKYDRRKSTYFYQDMLVGHDFHHYDFDRINDSAELKVWLCNWAKIYMDFNSYTKEGHSTTSLDISRDEFEFDKPVDESSKEVAVGLEMNIKRFSLVVEEKIQDYKNDYHFFIAGQDQGEDPYDMAYLNYFAVNNPYDFRSFTHTGKLVARPVDSLIIKASAVMSNQDMSVDYSDREGGTTYLGTPFTRTYTGGGQFEREMQMYDLDIAFLVSNSISFVGAVRYKSFDQDGTFDIYDVEMTDTLNFNTTGIEAGLQYQCCSNLGVTAGFRNEKREVEEDGGNMTTKRTGFFGNIKYNPVKWLKLTADYQMGNYEDPFTPVSPTDYKRARLSARAKFKNFYLNGFFNYKLAENKDNDDWTYETSRVSARAGYWNKTVKFGLGYSMLYTRNEGDRHFMFYGASSTWNILTEGRSTLIDAYVYLHPKKKWTVGFYGNYYMNEGYWELKRLILKPFIKVMLDGGFMGQLAYRYIEFNEDMYGLNDYIANIVEISFGYKW